MVERCRALRIGQSRCNLRNGALEEALDRGRVAFLSRAGRVGHRVGGAATLHAHRSTAGEPRVRDWVGSVDVASAGREKKRPPEESRLRIAPTQPFLGGLRPQNGVTSVCPRILPSKPNPGLLGTPTDADQPDSAESDAGGQEKDGREVAAPGAKLRQPAGEQLANKIFLGDEKCTYRMCMNKKRKGMGDFWGPKRGLTRCAIQPQQAKIGLAGDPV